MIVLFNNLASLDSYSLEALLTQIKAFSNSPELVKAFAFDNNDECVEYCNEIALSASSNAVFDCCNLPIH